MSNTRFHSPPRFDGAGYAVLAESLLAGQGYREIDHPERPPHAHYPPGRGIAPLKEDLEVLKKIGYDGSINLELENAPEPQKIREWVQEGYRVTDGLMNGLEIRN